MSDMSNRNIDRIFQQSSDNHDFAYNPDAWQQMEALLDDDKKDRKFIWWLFGIGALLLGAILAFYLLRSDSADTGDGEASHKNELSINDNAETKDASLKDYPQKDTQAESGSRSNQNQAIDSRTNNTSLALEGSHSEAKSVDGEMQAIDEAIINNAAQSNEASNTIGGANSTHGFANHTIANGIDAAEDEELNNAITDNLESKAKNFAEQNTLSRQPKALDDSTIRSIDELQSTDATSQTISNQENNKTQGLESDDANNDSQNVDYNDQSDRNTTIISETPSARELLVYKVSAINSIMSDLEYNNSMNVPEFIESKELVDIKQSDSGFRLGLMIGAERTEEVNTNIGQVDLKFGIDSDFLFKNKFSIGTGFYYVIKDYEAGAGAYMAPPGFWGGEAPVRTVAECRLFEIPLSFKYYFSGYNANGFNIGTSVSSFFMHREWYVYQYANPDPMQVQSWRGENKSRHWLAAADLSLGYQYKLNERFSLRGVSYMQLPLSGIGHGKIKLRNAGVRINFGYHFK